MRDGTMRSGACSACSGGACKVRPIAAPAPAPEVETQEGETQEGEPIDSATSEASPLPAGKAAWVPKIKKKKARSK